MWTIRRDRVETLDMYSNEAGPVAEAVTVRLVFVPVGKGPDYESVVTPDVYPWSGGVALEVQILSSLPPSGVALDPRQAVLQAGSYVATLQTGTYGGALRTIARHAVRVV